MKKSEAKKTVKGADRTWSQPKEGDVYRLAGCYRWINATEYATLKGAVEAALEAGHEHNTVHVVVVPAGTTGDIAIPWSSPYVAAKIRVRYTCPETGRVQTVERKEHSPSKAAQLAAENQELRRKLSELLAATNSR